MSRRTERLGSLIRTLVAEAIQSRLSDPRIATITSVTRVVVSEDLAAARIMVSVMGTEAERNDCLCALCSAAGRIRGAIGDDLALRKVPVLSFHLDDSVRGSLETVAVIERTMRELAAAPAEKPADEAAAEAEQRSAETGAARDESQEDA